MGKKFFNKKSFLFKYISALFCVLMIPSVFGYVVSEASLHSTLEEIKNKNYQSLSHIQRSFDSDLSEIKQLSIEIASGENLAAYSEAPPGSYTGYDIANAEFFPYGTATRDRDYVQEVIIYNRDNNIIINSSSSIYTVDQFCEQVLDIHQQDKVNFIGMLNTPSFNALHPAMDIRIYNRMEYSPYIFQSQSYPFLGDYEGNVLVMLDVDKMLDDFSDKFENNDCAFYIIDKNGRFLLSAGNKSYISADFINAEEGYGNSRINGEKITYSVRNSSSGKFKYVLIEDAGALNSAVAPIRMAIYIYIIFVLLFGTIGIYLIAKKNTQPVRELSGMLEDANHEKNSPNEIEHIQSAIRNILSEKARMEPIIEESESALRKSLISDILRGKFMSTEQLDEACRKVELSFRNQYFCVVYFSLAEILPEDIPVIKYAISNISIELFASLGEVYTDDTELHSLVAIINPSENSEETNNTILSQLRFIRNFFIDNFEAELVIGVGNIATSAEQISSSYSQSREAAEYGVLTSSKEILAYSNIKTTDYRYSYPLEVEDKLHSAVINGDIEQVRELIDQVVSANHSLSLDMSRCLFFDLTATALKIISNKAINLSLVFGSVTSPFEKLMECKNIAELVDVIHDIFEKICTQITESHSAKKDRLKVAITDYVKKNYNNPNMSLSMVADEFSMNYTYMSHFFKDFIGANFIDYISDLRIKKASELLRTTDMPINEIATTVGYANATVLIKIFKKLTNTTPGTYRKNSKT